MSAAIVIAGAGVLLTVLGSWAYTGHWTTWFTRSLARGRVEYTGPAALFTGIALLLAAGVIAAVLAGAPKPAAYALIVPVAASAVLAVVSSTVRPPSFLIPAWTRSVSGSQKG